MSENEDDCRQDAPAHGWPGWLTDLGPGMGILLEAIDRHREELERECMHSHVYKRLGQAQIRQFEEAGQRHGFLRASSGGGRLNYEVMKKAQLPPNLLRAAVYNVGQRHHTVKAYHFGKKVFFLKMLTAMSDALRGGNLFAGFGAMRALLENLGEMNRLAELMAGVKEQGDARATGALLDDILNREFGTRVDWAKLTTADFRQMGDEASLRTQPAGRKDDVPEALLGIRSLAKRIHGVLPIYEVLNEFTQPRVGTLWLVYEDSKTMPDRARTTWNRNQLGIAFPRAMVEQMQPVIVQVFDILYNALGLLKQFDKELLEIDARMARTTQDEVRTMLWHFPDIFDKHEDCPCGSGKRVKYCCGQ